MAFWGELCPSEEVSDSMTPLFESKSRGPKSMYGNAGLRFHVARRTSNVHDVAAPSTHATEELESAFIPLNHPSAARAIDEIAGHNAELGRVLSGFTELLSCTPNFSPVRPGGNKMKKAGAT